MRGRSDGLLGLVLLLGGVSFAGCGGEEAASSTPVTPETDAAAALDALLTPDTAQGEDEVSEADCTGRAQFADCDDGNLCTETDRCLDGVCLGTVVNCEDGDPCTIGTCHKDSGCIWEAVEASCDDQNPCTHQDTCTSEGCKGAPLSGAACTDHNVCTQGDQCDAGECIGELNLCNDLNPCTTDFCDPVHEAAIQGTGCVHLAVQGPSGAVVPCDDVNTCTSGDVCVGGECVGELQPGSPCSDGNLCTVDDLCDADGVCVGTGMVNCEDDNPCTIDGCDSSGGCVNEPEVGAPCDDGKLCTVEDQCSVTGACTGQPKCAPLDACLVGVCNDNNGACAYETLSCEDFNQCTTDTCDPDSGCLHEPLPGACDDGDECTTEDVCVLDLCLGTITVCDDGLDTPCTKNLCNSSTGVCSPTHVNGLSCNDDDLCSLDDTCSLGSCKGIPNLCGDANPCTSDLCIQETGECVNEEVSVCEDLAFERTNEYRQVLDLPIITNHDAIKEAAEAHCLYYVTHQKEVYGELGTSPHSELPGYEGYTGSGFGDRMFTAGYPNSPMFEVMAFVNDPVIAVDEWMATLYHRIPFVLPDAKEMGYGAAQKGQNECDTIDFGTYGEYPAAYDGMIIPFPPDGMIDVPISWDGLENPQPPLPNPYPSGPILTVTFAGQGIGVSVIDSAIQGPNGPVAHVANSPTTDPDLCCGVIALYPNAPLNPLTTYAVLLDYSRNGVPGQTIWTFTTGTGASSYFLD